MSSEPLALDRTQLARTLDLLTREQRRLRRYPLWFHLHRAMVVAFFGSVAVLLFLVYILPEVASPPPELLQSRLPIALVAIAAVSAVLTVPCSRSTSGSPGSSGSTTACSGGSG